MNSFKVNYNKRQALNTCISLPASKSESNRVLIIRAMCESGFPVINLSDAADTVIMSQMIEKIKKVVGFDIPVDIDVHNAGTVMRFLIALLAVTPGKWHIYGDERMNHRPVGILIENLQKLGANVSYTHDKDFPPIQISGKAIEGGEISIDAGTSSQFISALMLVAPVFKNGLTLHLTGEIVSHPYIRLTAHVMRHFGANVIMDDRNIRIESSAYYPASYIVESDWSAASYWYEMAAFSASAEVKLMNLRKDSAQGDSVLVEIFKDFGILTEYHDGHVLLRKGSKPLIASFEYDFTDCPDLAQTLAVTCAGLGIKARLSGLKTLKIKETDRLSALYSELNQAGYQCVIEGDATLIIESAENNLIRPCSVNTYHDHRMAMSFAPLAMLRESVTISEPGVVVKSYPDFWENMKSSGFIIT